MHLFICRCLGRAHLPRFWPGALTSSRPQHKFYAQRWVRTIASRQICSVGYFGLSSITAVVTLKPSTLAVSEGLRSSRKRIPSTVAAPVMGEAASAKLAAKDVALLELFLSICCYKWEALAELGQECLVKGATAAELQGCVRHICVVAGYPPALAAVKKLHAAGVMKEAEPGKAGGQPGNAFELVYADKRDRVWENLYSLDPVLSEWIRCHCYGDIYSNPGLDLRQKQLMTAAFLAEANMHDEFFGHVLAGLRFGSTSEEIIEAVGLAFETAGSQATKQEIQAHAVRLIHKAAYKVAQTFPEGVPPLPEVECGEVRKPEPPAQPAKSRLKESQGE